MRAPLKQRKPTPDEAVRIATETAPRLPPAQMPQMDRPVTFTMRLKSGTLSAIEFERPPGGRNAEAADYARFGRRRDRGCADRPGRRNAQAQSGVTLVRIYVSACVLR